MSRPQGAPPQEGLPEEGPRAPVLVLGRAPPLAATGRSLRSRIGRIGQTGSVAARRRVRLRDFACRTAPCCVLDFGLDPRR